MVHFFNIRGTNGSGKTTLASAFVKTPHEVITSYADKDGRIWPGEIHFDPDTGVIVVGRYVEGQCGGTDKIKTQAGVRHIVSEAAKLKGARVVIFEGLLVSGLYGKYMEFSRELRSAGHEYSWAFVIPSLDECIRRVIARSKREPGPNLHKNVEAKYIAVKQVREKALADKERVLDLPTNDPDATLDAARRYLGL